MLSYVKKVYDPNNQLHLILLTLYINPYDMDYGGLSEQHITEHINTDQDNFRQT